MIDAVYYDRDPQIVPSEGIKAVKIVCAIYESARTGKTIQDRLGRGRYGAIGMLSSWRLLYAAGRGTDSSLNEVSCWKAHQIIAEAGYSYSEICAGLLCELSEEEVARLAQAHGAGKLPLEVCNSFIPGDLPILEPGKQEALRRYTETVIARASRLGIDTIVFGSGKARRIPEGMSREEGIAGIHNFLRMCNAFGEQYDVTIAIEPLNRRECNVLNTVAEGAEMVHALQLSKVRLLADAFHMYCEAEDFSVLQRGERF
ncbi:MAG: sugar phosphate isomerase/epimerase family protein [Clostridia bacterium]